MRTHLFKNGPEALAALVQRLRSRKVDLSERHIVLTPDRYTQTVERALFCGGGALDCEVLTLSRLVSRMDIGVRPLSREAAVMLTARATAAVRSELKYYGRAARYTDFAREAFDAVQQIASSCADAGELAAEATSPVLKAKLGDLALIKAEYDRLRGERADAQGRLAALAAHAADSELVRSAHFYAIGYADATALNRDVFSALDKAALSFDDYDAYPPEPEPKKIEVCRAPDSAAQYKTVAARIREYVYKGGNYGDVAVVCPDPRTAARIFREYGIDFYYDNESPLFDTPPLAAIDCAYRLRSGALDAETAVALCKNPYSGCEPYDAERLQYALDKRGAAYVKRDGVTGDAAADRALDRAKKLGDMFAKKTSFADACLRMIDECDFEGVFKRTAETAADFSADDDLVFTDAVKPILGIIESLKSYGDGDPVSDAAAFFSAARAIKVKSLPRYADRAAVCDASALRLTAAKLLFVTDFNEGVTPSVTSDGGLLSDAEINSLGGAVEPTAREINRRTGRELEAVMRCAERVVCTYKTSGGGRRAAFLQRFEGDGGCITETDRTEELGVLSRSSDAALIARFACTRSVARELAARGATAYTESLKRAAGADRATPPHSDRVDGMRPKSLSVSEITHWFECPYKRFVGDAVGVKPRRRGAFTAPDFGTVLHDFMKEFIAVRPLDCSREFAERTLDGIIDKRGLFVSAVEREGLVRDAVRFAELNKRIIEAGGFEPVGGEQAFSGAVMLGASKIPFSGVIDRIDACGGHLRIIDYKTGNRKFDFGKCRDGRDMQLPLYAAAAADRGRVTGFYYLSLGSAYDGERRLVGCTVKDVALAAEHDGKLLDGEPSDVISARLNAKGAFDRPNKYLLDAEEFERLVGNCVDTAGVAADEIESGYIARVPAEGACDTCYFSALCYGRRERGGAEGDGQ